MKCALCGYEFDSTALRCHSACPLSAGCRIVCCPNCGYQTVDVQRSVSANLLLKLKSALNRAQPATG
jgi:predicted Zn-ribbon and HTH transcriptional regulator